MRASKRIATAITFNFSFWCSSKELRRTHRPARPCKRSTCKKKTNKQTNKQTKKHTCDNILTDFRLVTEKIHYFSISSTFAIAAFISTR